MNTLTEFFDDRLNNVKKRQMVFRKMNGAGNDFVIVDRRNEKEEFNISKDEIRKICDRNFGIGCDQFILIMPPTNKNADVKLLFYNQDGSESSACGNGSRCVASFLMCDHPFIIETDNRLLMMKKNHDDAILANMGVAHYATPALPKAEEIDLLLQAVPEATELIPADVGNPHAIYLGIPQEKIEHLALAEIGAPLAKHKSFAKGCNVSFLHKIDATNYRIRVWERGAGITKACGTAACAAMAAIHKPREKLPPHEPPRHIKFHMNGGIVEVTLDDEQNLWLTGPAEMNFQGSYFL